MNRVQKANGIEHIISIKMKKSTTSKKVRQSGLMSSLLPFHLVLMIPFWVDMQLSGDLFTREEREATRVLFSQPVREAGQAAKPSAFQASAFIPQPHKLSLFVCPQSGGLFNFLNVECIHLVPREAYILCQALRTQINMLSTLMLHNNPVEM